MSRAWPFIALALAVAAPHSLLAQSAGEGAGAGEAEQQQAVAPTREEMLDRLFGQLKKSEDDETSQVVEKAIWGLWSRSGSPTGDALLAQASRAISAEQYRIAESILDTLVSLQPDFPEAWNKRATLYYLERQFDRSLADINKTLELEPRHFGALSGLGIIRREKGDNAGALKAFRRALSINPRMQNAKDAVKELELESEQNI